jgi:hypothetical protein
VEGYDSSSDSVRGTECEPKNWLLILSGSFGSYGPGSELEGDITLKSAAAIFTGNTIATLRLDSRWTAYEGGSPTVGNRRRQFEIDRLLDALRAADEAAV